MSDVRLNLEYSNKDILAKLMATENITVLHKKTPTAYFDVKNRTLVCPMLKDNMSSEMYDLFMGHEVGHALNTPLEGWHDSVCELGPIFKGYLNVVEDVRIEKKIKTKYPGLRRSFYQGYKELANDDFFGIKNSGVEDLNLIDKINIHFKIGSLARVQFTDEEMVYIERCKKVKTFEEVLVLAKELFEKQEAESKDNIQSMTMDELQAMMEDLGIEVEENPEGNTEINILEETDEGEANSSSHDPATEEPTKESQGGGDEASSDDDKDKSTENKALDKGEGEEDVSITDDAHREAERTLLEKNDRGEQPLFIRGPSKEVMKYVMHSFKDVHKARLETMEKASFDPAKNGIMDGYKYYIAQVKKASNFAVKEFEMRKAGYQWQRAETAKTGSLDMNKIHSYKFNEDIFKRVTRLANAKNHGMIMFIDYSGSMGRTIPQVIDQLIHLVVFCKGINIPFDVYAFTTGNKFSKHCERYCVKSNKWM